MSNRKDDHIHSALKQLHLNNDFDFIRLLSNSVGFVDVDDVDIRVNIFDRTFLSPLYINAMSGGSHLSQEVNDQLSKLASYFGFPMATGSLSAAIKDATWEDSFNIINKNMVNGFKMANIGLSRSKEDAQRAIDIIQADALQIHLNVAQEITMPEGDRAFKHWSDRMKEICAFVNVPVIVKEVGFGMTSETVSFLRSIGISYVDVSGKGGTNFISIENDRREKRLSSFENYGISTVESLLDNQDQEDITVFASGGIRDAYDVVKALSLGAKMVGMSGYFLKLVTNHTIEEAIQTVETLIQDIKGIMAVLNVRNIDELKAVKKIYHGSVLEFVNQRKK
jgi:isopentenyl-diphosphate delta-isomerase